MDFSKHIDHLQYYESIMTIVGHDRNECRYCNYDLLRLEPSRSPFRSRLYMYDIAEEANAEDRAAMDLDTPNAMSAIDQNQSGTPHWDHRVIYLAVKDT